MNSYDVLRKVHQIGSPITGTVISRDKLEWFNECPSGSLALETESAYPALLPYDHLVDQRSAFSSDIIPEVRSQIDAVVFNFVDDQLYLSAKPKDLGESTIRKWQEYYHYIDTLTIGSTITGVVEQTEPFGLFIDIDGPFIGLIDIGHRGFNGGIRLPRDYAIWPKKGDAISCCVGYFRLHDKQIGLGWLPKRERKGG